MDGVSATAVDLAEGQIHLKKRGTEAESQEVEQFVMMMMMMVMVMIY